MDDGLQNPSLQKDFSIAVIDARRGLGNGYVFPAGPLRAPLSRQLAQVHAILVVGAGENSISIETLARDRGLPVLRARLEPPRNAAAAIGSRKVLAFAGIGNPDKFYRTLAEAGIDVTARQSFADHHLYSEDDAASILSLCEKEALVPVTTEKDIARLSGQDGARGRLAAAAKAVPVTLVADDPALLAELLQNALKTRRQRD
jgi:tetraacyldisaccharide 4'-kinase